MVYSHLMSDNEYFEVVDYKDVLEKVNITDKAIDKPDHVLTKKLIPKNFLKKYLTGKFYKAKIIID